MSVVVVAVILTALAFDFTRHRRHGHRAAEAAAGRAADGRLSAVGSAVTGTALKTSESAPVSFRRVGKGRGRGGLVGNDDASA